MEHLVLTFAATLLSTVSQFAANKRPVHDCLNTSTPTAITASHAVFLGESGDEPGPPKYATARAAGDGFWPRSRLVFRV